MDAWLETTRINRGYGVAERFRGRWSNNEKGERVVKASILSYPCSERGEIHVQMCVTRSQELCLLL